MSRTPLIALMLASLLIIGLAPAAMAEDTVCTGTIGATAEDNIVVPDGASCTLEGTAAEGSVLIGTDATLVADGVDVIGNVQAEGAAAVTLTGSEVDGSVQIVQGGTATIVGNALGSDVQVFSQSGATEIRDNTIDGNLQCKENAEQPTGGANVVGGNAEDQCAALTGAPTTDPGTDPTPDPGTDPTPDPGTDPAADRSTSRLFGPDRFSTAVAISADQFPAGAPTVYLARADESADAIAGGVLTDGPILLVPSCGELPAVVAGEIARVNPSEVIALGGPGAICDAMLDQAGAA